MGQQITLPSPRIEIFTIQSGEFALLLVNKRNERSEGMEVFKSRTEQVQEAIRFKKFLDWPIVDRAS